MSHFHCDDCDATIEVPEDRTFEVCPVCHLDKACELRPIVQADGSISLPRDAIAEDRQREPVLGMLAQILYAPAAGEPAPPRDSMRPGDVIHDDVSVSIPRGWTFTQEEMNLAGRLSGQLLEFRDSRQSYLRRTGNADRGISSLLMTAAQLLRKINAGP